MTTPEVQDVLATAEEHRKTRLGAHGVRFAAFLRIADCLKWPIRRVRRPPKAPGTRPTLPHIRPESRNRGFHQSTRQNREPCAADFLRGILLPVECAPTESAFNRFEFYKLRAVRALLHAARLKGLPFHTWLI